MRLGRGLYVVFLAMLLTIALPSDVLAEESPAGTFDAVAEVTSSQGTRSMPIGIAIRTPISIQDAAHFRETLSAGGQQALLNAIRNSMTGRLVLGTIEYPINLVIAERMDDGWKYTVVTARNVSWQEYQLKEPSLDYPFTVAVFEVPDGRRGEGLLSPRAALSVGEDGRVSVETFEGTKGRLKEIKRR